MQHIFRCAVLLSIEGLTRKPEGSRKQLLILKMVFPVTSEQLFAFKEDRIFQRPVSVKRVSLFLRAIHVRSKYLEIL